MSPAAVIGFGVVWALIMAGTALLALTDHGGRARPILLRSLVIGAGLVVLAFAYLKGVLAIAVPLVLLIVAVNLWRLRFCPHCQKLNGNSLMPARFCGRCGQPMRPVASP